MDEKYCITLYKKIIADDKYIILKRDKIIPDAYIDLSKDEDEATYYDEEGKCLVVQDMNNDNGLIADDPYVYGFPMTLSSLKIYYPDVTNPQELIEKYKQDISEVLVFGYYNKDKDKISLLITNESAIKDLDEDDELFDMFTIISTDDGDDEISLTLRDLDTIETMVKNGQTKELETEIRQLKKNINECDESLKDSYDFLNEDEETQTNPTVKEKVLDSAKTKENLDSSINKLNELIGLENVKEEIHKLLYYTLFKAKVKDSTKLENPKLSMFFSGNPGTGKTTVARLLGDILYNMGYLSNNKFVEITPKDLIGEYVGQTAVKTNKLLKKYEGGVIFIDEAYVLASRAQEYAQEALVEILKELEKNNTIFIFAGYEKEMADFMNSNPGLTSRIGYNLNFKDYTVEELHQMFINKITKMGFKITDELNEAVNNLIVEAKTDNHFGNGRYIDKIIDKIIEEHAKNTYQCDSQETLLTITKADINRSVNNTILSKKLKSRIGFY